MPWIIFPSITLSPYDSAAWLYLCFYLPSSCEGSTGSHQTECWFCVGTHRLRLRWVSRWAFCSTGNCHWDKEHWGVQDRLLCKTSKTGKCAGLSNMGSRNKTPRLVWWGWSFVPKHSSSEAGHKIHAIVWALPWGNGETCLSNATVQPAQSFKIQPVN